MLSAVGTVRRCRAAVYAVCGGVKEVDRAFECLEALMLSERRESYYWGVMLDHAPGALYRTFGDREMEERARTRFSELCRKYKSCGFFCLLRSRRYGKDRVFRCENGLSGALRMLAGGRDEGFDLRLSTGDRVERSDRMLVLSIGNRDMPPIAPGTLSCSEGNAGAVMIPFPGQSGMDARRGFRRVLEGASTGNYRVFGWFPLICSPKTKTIMHRLTAPFFEMRRISVGAMEGVSRVGRGEVWLREWESERAGDRNSNSPRFGVDIGLAARLAASCFKHDDGTAVERYVIRSERRADIEAWSLIAGMSLYALGEIDAVILRDLMEKSRKALTIDGAPCDAFNPGLVRIALLISSLWADAMEVYDGGFANISESFGEAAEYMRVEYESGRRLLRAPFSPSEMLVYRCENVTNNGVFRGFAALRRLSDCFLYVLFGSEDEKRKLLRELLSSGFGSYGICAENGAFYSGNALLVALCAELKTRCFSRALASVPELLACRSIGALLPEAKMSRTFFSDGFKLFFGEF